MDIEDQIPPSLALQKGGISPLWQRGVRGDFQNNMSAQLWTPSSIPEACLSQADASDSYVYAMLYAPCPMRSVIRVCFQHREKGALGNGNRSNGLHPLFALLLFLQKFPLTGNITP